MNRGRRNVNNKIRIFIQIYECTISVIIIIITSFENVFVAHPLSTSNPATVTMSATAHSVRGSLLGADDECLPRYVVIDPSLRVCGQRLAQAIASKRVRVYHRVSTLWCIRGSFGGRRATRSIGRE